MGWGTHCHQCGFESCAWTHGIECEGRAHPAQVKARDAFDRLPVYWRMLRTRPAVIYRTPMSAKSKIEQFDALEAELSKTPT